MIKVYGVVFDNNKIYNFKAEDLACPINVTVIVETEKGEQFGKVVKEINEVNDNYNSIIRIATKQDYTKYLENLRIAKEALDYCRGLVKEMNLPMNIIDSSYTFDRHQLLFNFLADERIDFRELARKLAAKYRTRIELRQIGARDKAKMVNGIGICGRTLCCASFLNKIDSISMNMAKNQGIALNPSKINGCCGRLLCCLTYEDKEYSRCRKGMPNVNDQVSINGENGRVIELDVLNRKYKVSVNNEVKEVVLDSNEDSKE